MTGIELIAKERQEQIEKHGRTIEKDVEQNHARKLLLGALALIDNGGDGNSQWFPKEWDRTICEKMFDKEYKERIIIAGAFLAAELDRLQANENKTA